MKINSLGLLLFCGVSFFCLSSPAMESDVPTDTLTKAEKEAGIILGYLELLVQTDHEAAVQAFIHAQIRQQKELLRSAYQKKSAARKNSVCPAFSKDSPMEVQCVP